MNEFIKDKSTSEQLIDLIDDELEITISRDVVYGLDYEYKQYNKKTKNTKK